MNLSTLSLQKSPLPTCRILWDHVPSAYKEAIVFSDYWSAYRAVIPSEQQRPVGKETGKRLILSV